MCILKTRKAESYSSICANLSTAAVVYLEVHKNKSIRQIRIVHTAQCPSHSVVPFHSPETAKPNNVLVLLFALQLTSSLILKDKLPCFHFEFQQVHLVTAKDMIK